MDLTVEPLTRARWADLEAIFSARGCSVARSCWCMYYRDSGPSTLLAPGERRPDHSRRELQAWASSEMPAGLIGYEGSQPVGWVSLGPRGSYRKLEKSPVMKPVDGQSVWSIVCFVVPAEHRRRGVAARLLAGATEYARQRGVRLLEAYPVDREAFPQAEGEWFGKLAMYQDAGFTEVARRKPARPVVRLRLEPASEVATVAPAAGRGPLRLEPASQGELVMLAEDRVPPSIAARVEPGALPPPFVAQRSLAHRAAGASWDWCGMFYMVDVESARIVGTCGFKTEPQAGQVEIGYGVAASWRGHGVATAAVRQLLDMARHLAPGVAVVALVNPENLPSTAVVRRLGFHAGGECVDTDGERLVQWVHRAAAC